ncbi:MAG: AraC family transcriptional regulator [Reichenbachiella sp.]|uniref:helix-turn-helix domain-containing protein n=1 Tax=Reichenbachiella sp. TaxID=2184521 RepID=UPI0032655054
MAFLYRRATTNIDLESIKKYDLHKYDHSKLHFELNHAWPYFDKNRAKATKPHRHSFFQVIWFKQSGRHYIDYEVINHPANTVFLINKNQVHHFCSDSVNEGYLFHFNEIFIMKYAPDFLERFSVSLFNEIGGNQVLLPEEESTKLEAITTFILSELESKDFFYNDLVFYHFQTLLLNLERHRKKQVADFELSPDYSLAVAYKKLVIAQLDKFHSIDQYANELNIGSKKLIRVCKKILLDTPANIVKQLKILEAKRMLSNQKVSIKEVGYALGFDQSTYFTKYFKKETGITPKEFQRSIL